MRIVALSACLILPACTAGSSTPADSSTIRSDLAAAQKLTGLSLVSMTSRGIDVVRFENRSATSGTEFESERSMYDDDGAMTRDGAETSVKAR